MKETIKQTKSINRGLRHRSSAAPSLINSELRYRRLFEAAQDGILILDAETGMINDVNPYLIKMLGYSRAEFVKKKLWQVGAFQDIEASKDAFEALQKNEYIRYADLPLKTKDGRLIQVEFVSNVYRVGDEQVIQCNIRNITARISAEQALRESEERYQNLARISPVGIFRTALDGSTTYVNPKWCAIAGLSSEQAMGYGWLSAVHPDDKDKLSRGWKSSAQLREPSVSDYRFVCPDGTISWVMGQAVPELNIQGETIGYVGTITDITARREDEQRVRESTQRFKTLFEQSPIAIALLDSQGYPIISNLALEKMVGYSRAELAKIKFAEFTYPDDVDKDLKQFTELIAGKISAYTMEKRFVHKNGSLVWTNLSVTILRDENGVAQDIIGMAQDITEQKRAEETLRESEEKYRMIVETTAEGIWVVDQAWKTTYVNPAMVAMLGYAENELLGHSPMEFVDPEEAARVSGLMKRREQGITEKTEVRMRRKDGAFVWTYGTSVSLLNDNGEFVGGLSLVADVTERKRAEEQIAFQANLLAHVNDAVIATDENFIVTSWNHGAEKIYDWKAEEVIGEPAEKAFHAEFAETSLADFRAQLSKAGEYFGEVTQYRKDGTRIVAEGHTSVLHAQDGKIIGYLTVNRDITARKRAEESLHASQLIIEEIINTIPMRVFWKDKNLVYLGCNAAFARDAGFANPKDLIGKDDYQMAWRDQAELYRGDDRQVIESGNSKLLIEVPSTTPDGKTTTILTSKVPLLNSKGEIIGALGTYMDISGRKRAEESLRETEERYRILVETLPDGVIVHSQGRIVFANPASATLIGAPNSADLTGKPVIEFVHPDYREMALKRIQQSLIESTPVPLAEEKFVRLDGTPVDVEVSAIPFSYAGKPAMLTVFNEITARKRAAEKIQRQLDHLTALSVIDRVIASNFDIRISLSEILTHVTKELGVDAAWILIFNSNLQLLEFGAERGFRTKGIRKNQVRLGESLAGRVALERRLVQIQNLKDEPDNFLLATLLKEDEFVCYYGVPLIAKGQVKGVLEVFHRAVLEPDAEWLDFLNTLAGQAAIAIESATLFESLQRSNLELNLAYDATIEGWSHALDLRDKETEGHTQRVTEMTVKLARTFGLSEAELVQVRWGSLLHDIGKMGVPDGILFKPGALTDEEWVAMKMHPTFAYEMLSPIRYLRQALDIPYCHHEKWDGTGYPRGLVGEQIPLVARIFAVVDVWDALRSDRPYRKAWDEAKIREHIQSLAETHFDPKIVQAFLQLVEQTLLDARK